MVDKILLSWARGPENSQLHESKILCVRLFYFSGSMLVSSTLRNMVWDQNQNVIKLPPAHSCQGLLHLYTRQFDPADGNPAQGCTGLSHLTKSGNSFLGSRRFPSQHENCLRHLAGCLS